MNKLALAALTTCTLFLGTTGCDDDGREDTEICDWECALGSRYPCPCTAESGCSDGATCGALDPAATQGFCSRACETDVTCETTLECLGVGKCISELFGAGTSSCAFTCGGDADCPSNMECIEAAGHQICYPY